MDTKACMENGEHVLPIERYHIMDVVNWTQ
jgi:hypothetical protein